MPRLSLKVVRQVSAGGVDIANEAEHRGFEYVRLMILPAIERFAEVA